MTKNDCQNEGVTVAVKPRQKEITYTVRIFPEDETTKMVYPKVTHAFWEAGNTVLTLCLPKGKHAHWLREWIRHYDVVENQ